MKELYAEGLANHSGHESCADDREVVREALDSGMHRLGIEPRKIAIRVPTLYRSWEGNTVDIVKRDITDSAWSETLHMCRNSLRGNREILRLTLLL